MADPFASALAALFGAAGSEAAIYTPKGGAPLPDPIRIIRGTEVGRNAFMGGEVTAPAPLAEIQRADVSVPRSGDRLDVLGADEVTIVASFTLAGDPKGDVEGLTWFADLVPA